MYRAQLAALLFALSIASSGLAAETPLPESLGQWYKPQNERQVWLHTMFAMRRELQAVREYAAAQDAERLRKWGQKLADHYQRLPEMVPEWRDETDLSLLDELNRRIETGDFAAVQRAADRLDDDCRACHREYQALAALRYRWPRFDTLRITDRDGAARPYGEHMQLLSTTLNRIKIASDDHRWDAAGASLGALRAQLDALGDGCATCHSDSVARERILGAATLATFDKLERALAERAARDAGRALGEAAVQTCARCHGVHRMLAAVRQHLFD